MSTCNQLHFIGFLLSRLHSIPRSSFLELMPFTYRARITRCSQICHAGSNECRSMRFATQNSFQSVICKLSPPVTIQSHRNQVHDRLPISVWGYPACWCSWLWRYIRAALLVRLVLANIIDPMLGPSLPGLTFTPPHCLSWLALLSAQVSATNPWFMLRVVRNWWAREDEMKGTCFWYSKTW